MTRSGATASAPGRHRQAAHQVRIIGGRWKRTPLAVVDSEGLRPTPDRVRETVFNWLTPGLTGASCLDLFAGTGALGLEAVSRGAAQAWLVEPERRALRALEAVVARLGAAGQVQVQACDAASAIARARREGCRFDLVFLDPPFGAGWLDRVLPLLGEVLAPGARVYVESETALDEARVAGWLEGRLRLQRAERAGQVFYHLLVLDSSGEL